MKFLSKPNQPLKWLLMLGFVALASVAHAAVQPETAVGFPRDVSLNGHRIDWLIDITGIFTIILFVIMCIWMTIAYFFHDEGHQADYDHGHSKHHIIIALALSAGIFVVVDGNLFVNSIKDLDEAFWNFSIPDENPDTVRIEVNARQWAWQMRYAGPDDEWNTADDIVTLNDMRIPVDTPVHVQLAASDVIHSFWLPNLRQKMDAVPGYVNQLWFQATETGEFDLACAQHCGTNHYKMKGKLTILSKEDYAAWHAERTANCARAFDAEDTSAQWGWAWKQF